MNDHEGDINGAPNSYLAFWALGHLHVVYLKCNLRILYIQSNQKHMKYFTYILSKNINRKYSHFYFDKSRFL